MAKKSTTIEEFIITINDNNSVNVSRIYKSTIEVLKIIAKMNGLDVDPKWNTQRLGKVLLDNYCGGEKVGTIGEYTIERERSGRINVLQNYKNTLEGLRQCSQVCGFEFDPKWNTQTFGNKLVTAAESGALGLVSKPKKANIEQCVDNGEDEVDEKIIEEDSNNGKCAEVHFHKSNYDGSKLGKDVPFGNELILGVGMKGDSIDLVVGDRCWYGGGQKIYDLLYEAEEGELVHLIGHSYDLYYATEEDIKGLSLKQFFEIIYIADQGFDSLEEDLGETDLLEDWSEISIKSLDPSNYPFDVKVFDDDQQKLIATFHVNNFDDIN